MVQNTACSSTVYSEMLFERKQFGNDRHHATRCRGYKVQSCRVVVMYYPAKLNTTALMSLTSDIVQLQGCIHTAVSNQGRLLEQYIAVLLVAGIGNLRFIGKLFSQVVQSPSVDISKHPLSKHRSVVQCCCITTESATTQTVRRAAATLLPTCYLKARLFEAGCCYSCVALRLTSLYCH